MTVISEDSSIAVCPRPKGSGCYHGGIFRRCGSLSLPWLTAAGDNRTASLMTTVPVRLFTITRAATGAGVTASISISAIRLDRKSLPCGRASSMLTPSAMVAMPG